MPRRRANLHKLNQCSLWSLPPFTSIKSLPPHTTHSFPISTNISFSCLFFLSHVHALPTVEEDRVKIPRIRMFLLLWTFTLLESCLQKEPGSAKLQSKYHKGDTEHSTSMMTGVIIQHEMQGETETQPTHREPTISPNEMSYCSSARLHFYKRHH